MNILILSGRFGMGHIKAAAAIEEKVRARGEQVHVQTVDLVSYLFPHTSNSIYGGFHLMVSYCAELYNMLNKAVERTGAAPLKKASCRKIHRLLAETKADLIISVLPICTQYFAAYKQISGCQLPLYTLYYRYSDSTRNGTQMLAIVILSARVPRRKPCSFKEFLPKVSLSAVFRFCLLFARAVKRNLKFRVRTPRKNDSC